MFGNYHFGICSFCKYGSSYLVPYSLLGFVHGLPVLYCVVDSQRPPSFLLHIRFLFVCYTLSIFSKLRLDIDCD